MVFYPALIDSLVYSPSIYNTELLYTIKMSSTGKILKEKSVATKPTPYTRPSNKSSAIDHEFRVERIAPPTVSDSRVERIAPRVQDNAVVPPPAEVPPTNWEELQYVPYYLYGASVNILTNGGDPESWRN